MRSRAIWARGLLALTVAGTVPADSVEAQRPAARAQLEQRVRQRFIQSTRERLALDESQAEELVRILGDFRQERAEISAETRALRMRVRGAVRSAGEGPLDDGEAQTFLDELRALAEREAQVVIAERDALSEIMRPGQVVLFYHLRDQMNERIRQLRNRRGNGPA